MTEPKGNEALKSGRNWKTQFLRKCFDLYFNHSLYKRFKLLTKNNLLMKSYIITKKINGMLLQMTLKRLHNLDSQLEILKCSKRLDKSVKFVLKRII